MSEVEQTPIPVVQGRTIAIGQSLSIVVLQRSCGTRRRPVGVKNDKDKLNQMRVLKNGQGKTAKANNQRKQ